MKITAYNPIPVTRSDLILILADPVSGTNFKMTVDDFTGTLHNDYVWKRETGQYAPAGMTGQFVTTALTGVLTPRGETGHLHSQYALSAGTGQFVSTALTGVLTPRGETGHIHSQYATSVGTGQFISTAQTGAFAPLVSTGFQIVNGNIQLWDIGRGAWAILTSVNGVLTGVAP